MTDAPSRRAATGRTARPRLLPAVLLAWGLCLLLSWPRVRDIWTANPFGDTDDAMRLVQVRAWLAGQGWFDLVAHRLNPPDGVTMHWSRVVDVPLGALVRTFAFFTTMDAAERLARITFPLLLQGLLVAATASTARVLVGRHTAWAAAFMVVLTGFTFGQFVGGRIDHHAPQIVLLMAMTGCLLDALDPRRWRRAATAAACMALSMAISLENLPFIAVLCATLPLAWLAEPAASRPAMRWFAGGLAVAVPACFLATVAPSRWTVVAGDALSAGQVAMALAGAGAMALLARLPPAAAGFGRRLAALAGVSAVLLALAGLAFPACLHGPYATLDPVLKRLWLDHVTEAQPLLRAIGLTPVIFTVLVCPLLLGGAAAAVAAGTGEGVARRRWLAVLALLVAGLAGALWEVRVLSSVQPLAVLGGIWAVSRIGWNEARRAWAPSGRVALAILAAPLFLPMAWAFVPSGDVDPVEAAMLERQAACRTAAALAPLAALPPGLVFAPIDDGAHLLVTTTHDVLAAPYHRNGVGNRAVVDGFLADPRSAEALVRRTGARYVALCPGEVDITVLAREAPKGLGAELSAGHVPPWLRSLPLAGSPYRVFEVLPPPG